MHHPARYALVEIENVHDEGLDFEPIHRVVFGVKKTSQPRCSAISTARSASSLRRVPPGNDRRGQSHPRGRARPSGLVTPQGRGVLIIHQPTSNLPVGSLQSFLDAWLQAGGAEKIDYVHGDDVI